MKATELRFGNRILLDGKEVVIDITQMCNFYFWAKNEQDYYPKRWGPIPLTDEWLEALGAERDHDFYVYDRFKLLWKKSYNYWYVMDRESLTYLTKIEFVHEWQNFVFAMNSE